jgi:hypothetical protein
VIPFLTLSQPSPPSPYASPRQYPISLTAPSPNEALIKEMMAAINPVLVSLSLKFGAGLKGLKVDLLSGVADLNGQISSHNAKVAVALQARIRGTPKQFQPTPSNQWEAQSISRSPQPQITRPLHLFATNSLPPRPTTHQPSPPLIIPPPSLKLANCKSLRNKCLR